MRTIWAKSLLCVLTATVAAADPSVDGGARAAPHDANSERSSHRFVPELPATFEVNRGQAPEGWDFVVRCRGYHAFVRSTGIVFSMDGAPLTMTFEGAAASPPETTAFEHRGRVNYLLGSDAEKWLTDVPTTRGTAYPEAIPGVTWRLAGRARYLEFTFDVEPGASVPTMTLAGAKAAAVASDGSLRLTMPYGAAAFSAPVAWQVGTVGRSAVAARWTVADGHVRIELAPHDTSRTVHIDPTVSYASYLGGGGIERIGSAAIGSDGSVFIGGETESNDFPVVAGSYDTSMSGPGPSGQQSDAFVCKVAADGSGLVYATYLGGTSEETVVQVLVDQTGGAHVLGNTASSNFPTTPGAFKASSGGDGFVTKLNASGSALAFSTCTSRNQPTGFALGAGGAVYVVEGSALALYASTGTSQTFLRAFASSGAAYRKVATDAAGDAYVAGNVFSASTAPATTGAYRSTIQGSSEVLLSKINATGNVIWTTYLGGSGTESPNAVAVNDAGQAYVAGTTTSTNFPVTSSALFPAFTSSPEGFVTRFNATGSALRHSTYLKGVEPRALAVHKYGSWVVAGTVHAGSAVLAVNGFQSGLGGDQDAFIWSFDRANSLAWSSFLGGSGYENCGFGMGADGTLAVIGSTGSTNFPVVTPFQGAPASSTDLFLAVVPDSLPTTYAPFSLPATMPPGATISAGYLHQLPVTGGLSPYAWTYISGTLPPGLTFSVDGTLSGTPSQSGPFSFRVRATDGVDAIAERDVALQVNGPPSVPAAIVGTTVGVPSDRAVSAAGGTAPFTFELTEGSMPAGLTLTAAGRVQGTAGATGDTAIKVRARDANGAAAVGNLTIRVNAAPAIVEAPLPAATSAGRYVRGLAAAGGTAPFTWSTVAGSFPIASPLQAGQGVIDGTAGAPGPYQFTVRVIDAVGAVDEHVFDLLVNPPMELEALALPPLTAGETYVWATHASGGTAPFVFSLTSGGVPAGLVVDAVSGDLSAAPLASGIATGALRCTDRNGAFAERQFQCLIAASADLTRRKANESFRVAGAPQPFVYRALDLLAGTALNVSLVGGSDASVRAAIALTDAAGAPIDLSAVTVTSSKAVSAKGFVVPATGRYLLRALSAPAFQGAMKLTIAIAPRAVWPGQVELPTGATAELAFSAPPGALVSIAAKAAKGSAALPRFVSLTGADAVDLVPGGTTKESRGTATFASKVPLAGGDYTVTLATRDGSAGPVTWTVKLKLPKTYDFTLPDLPAGE